MSYKSVKNQKGSTFLEVILSMMILGLGLSGTQMAVLSSMRYLNAVHKDSADLREQISQSESEKIIVSS